MYSTEYGPDDCDDTEDMVTSPVGGIHSVERMDMIGSFFDVAAASSKFGHIAQSRKDSNDGVIWPFDKEVGNKTYEQAG